MLKKPKFDGAENEGDKVVLDLKALKHGDILKELEEEASLSINGSALPLASTVKESWWEDLILLPGTMKDLQVRKITLNKKSSEPTTLFACLRFMSQGFAPPEDKEAQENFENTFSKGKIPENITEANVTKDTPLMDILLSEQIVSSKTEFRKLVSEGAISNMTTGEKITNSDFKAISGTYKIGKRRFIKIKIS